MYIHYIHYHMYHICPHPQPFDPKSNLKYDLGPVYMCTKFCHSSYVLEIRK